MPPPKEPAIRVRGLTQVYGTVTALREVDLDAWHGEIVGVLGPNGAGKSTLLETCAGLRGVAAGSVTTLGVDPTTRPRELRERVSVQPQQAALVPELTAHETVRLWSSFYRRPLPLDHVIGPLGIDDFVDRRVGVLSGGQFQRLRIALALVGDPEVVVLDEPSAGLDPTHRRALRQAVDGLRDERRCVVLSTHHMDEAEELCDRLVIVDGGRIVGTGTPSEIIAAHAPGCRLRFSTADVDRTADLARRHGFDLARTGARGGRDLVDVDVEEERLAEAIATLVGADGADVDIRRGDLDQAFAAVTGSVIDDQGVRRPSPAAEAAAAGPEGTR